jgi:hypothetical protein
MVDENFLEQSLGQEIIIFPEQNRQNRLAQKKIFPENAWIPPHFFTKSSSTAALTIWKLEYFMEKRILIFFVFINISFIYI